MKKIFLVLCVCALAACVKHSPPQLAIPIIETIGAKAVKVSAEIEDDGAGVVDIVGFCYSKYPVPTLADHQVLLDEIVGGFFSTTIDGFKPMDTIYFRAFASNEYGFQYSGVSKITFKETGPPIVPCVLTAGELVDNGSSFYASAIAGEGWALYGNYAIVVSISGKEYNFSFTKKPGNGIYTTSSGGDVNSSDENVYVSLNNGFSTYSMAPGGSVYVVENGDGTVTLSFCNLTYTPFSSPYIISGQVKVQVD